MRRERIRVPLDVSSEIEATLTGDRAASSRFVMALRPIVQARVARVLLRNRAAGLGRDIQQDIDDLTQDAFVTLFENDGRVIRRWRADGGVSLANFVGLVAQRRANQVLTSKHKSPWRDQPTERPELERALGIQSDFERQVESRDFLNAVLDALCAELDAQAQFLFKSLLIERRPIAELTADTGLSRDALYAWRSRLAKRARQISERLSSENAIVSQDLSRGAR